MSPSLRLIRSALRLATAGCLVLTAGIALADWRDDIKVFRVGVPVGENAAYRLRQAEPFRRYLEDRLGVHVELFPAISYDALIEAQSSDRVQYGIYSATAFASAEIMCDCLEPVAVPTAEDGSTGFHAVLVARADSAVHSLTDAKRARLAVGPEGSVTGRLVPFAAFAASGIDPRTYFSALIDTGSPEDAVAALLLGEADVALGWSSLEGVADAGYGSGVFTKMVADGTLAMSDIRLIWQSEPIPYGPHAIRRDLPSELKALVAEAILAMPSDDPEALDAISLSGGGGMVAADHAMFAALVRALTATSR